MKKNGSDGKSSRVYQAIEKLYPTNKEGMSSSAILHDGDSHLNLITLNKSDSIKLTSDFSKKVYQLVSKPKEQKNIKALIDNLLESTFSGKTSNNEEAMRKIQAELEEKMAYTIKKYLAVKMKLHDPKTDNQLSPDVHKFFDEIICDDGVPLIKKMVGIHLEVYRLDQRKKMYEDGLKLIDVLSDKLKRSR